eukprot:scpid91622/ scgid14435/ Phospholipase A2; Phosphatidylcholine 2-acylhydrolase
MAAMALKPMCGIFIMVPVFLVIVQTNALPSPIQAEADQEHRLHLDNQQKHHQQPLASRSRHRRSLVDFAAQIQCSTLPSTSFTSAVLGSNPGHLLGSALVWGSYGCWCGVGGSGRTVDAIDECCKVHDKCYERQDSCYPKSIPYFWHCENGAPICSSKEAKYWYDYLRGYNSGCMRRVCECDREAALCFRRHASVYSSSNVNLGQITC